VVSSPLFNALHSISRTRRGYLVASTGLDLLLEFNRDGSSSCCSCVGRWTL